MAKYCVQYRYERGRNDNLECIVLDAETPEAALLEFDKRLNEGGKRVVDPCVPTLVTLVG